MQNGGKNSNIHRHLKHWIQNFKTSLKNVRIKKKNIVYLEENKLMISFYSKYISTFNELRIKNTPVIKETIFVFKGFTCLMWTCLIPHCERKELYLKNTFPIKLYHYSNFESLVNFNFHSSTWWRSYSGSNLGKEYLVFLIFTLYHFKLWKRTKLTLLNYQHNS